MSEIIILSKSELAGIIRQAVGDAVHQLRDELQQQPPSELMDKAALAEYLGVHPATINRFMSDRGLPVEHCGDMPRFRKADIDLWLKGQHHPNVVSLTDRRAA